MTHSPHHALISKERNKAFIPPSTRVGPFVGERPRNRQVHSKGSFNWKRENAAHPQRLVHRVQNVKLKGKARQRNGRDSDYRSTRYLRLMPSGHHGGVKGRDEAHVDRIVGGHLHDNRWLLNVHHPEIGEKIDHAKTQEESTMLCMRKCVCTS